MNLPLRFRIPLALAVSLLLGAIGYDQSSASSSQFEANKNLVREFYENFPADPEAAARVLADDYIEHAPRFVEYNQLNHVSG